MTRDEDSQWSRLQRRYSKFAALPEAERLVGDAALANIARLLSVRSSALPFVGRLDQALIAGVRGRRGDLTPDAVIEAVPAVLEELFRQHDRWRPLPEQPEGRDQRLGAVLGAVGATGVLLGLTQLAKDQRDTRLGSTRARWRWQAALFAWVQVGWLRAELARPGAPAPVTADVELLFRGLWALDAKLHREAIDRLHASGSTLAAQVRTIGQANLAAATDLAIPFGANLAERIWQKVVRAYGVPALDPSHRVAPGDYLLDDIARGLWDDVLIVDWDGASGGARDRPRPCPPSAEDAGLNPYTGLIRARALVDPLPVDCQREWQAAALACHSRARLMTEIVPRLLGERATVAEPPQAPEAVRCAGCERALVFTRSSFTQLLTSADAGVWARAFTYWYGTRGLGTVAAALARLIRGGLEPAVGADKGHPAARASATHPDDRWTLPSPDELDDAAKQDLDTLRGSEWDILDALMIRLLEELSAQPGRSRRLLPTGLGDGALSVPPPGSYAFAGAIDDWLGTILVNAARDLLHAAGRDLPLESAGDRAPASTSSPAGEARSASLHKELVAGAAARVIATRSAPDAEPLRRPHGRPRRRAAAGGYPPEWDAIMGVLKPMVDDARAGAVEPLAAWWQGFLSRIDDALLRTERPRWKQAAAVREALRRSAVVAELAEWCGELITAPLERLAQGYEPGSVNENLRLAKKKLIKELPLNDCNMLHKLSGVAVVGDRREGDWRSLHQELWNQLRQADRSLKSTLDQALRQQPPGYLWLLVLTDNNKAPPAGRTNRPQKPVRHRAVKKTTRSRR